VNPADLPKMVEGIRRAARAYPALQTRVEESGEHALVGPGELYLDCVLHDLRHTYSDMEIKVRRGSCFASLLILLSQVSDPAVTFQETVIESSRLACHATTPNRQNRLTVQASPLEARVVAAAEAGLLPSEGLAGVLEQRFGWDVLACQGLWAFGPPRAAEPGRVAGTCALLDDTLTDEDSPEFSALAQSRASIVQGFQWACKEGPLTEDPLRGVTFKLVAARLAAEPFARGGGQLIPTARRVLYSAMLTAAPRLMEPVLRLEVRILSFFCFCSFGSLAGAVSSGCGGGRCGSGVAAARSRGGGAADWRHASCLGDGARSGN
jgi:U5 small nuclear ribonucleoprotein component